MPPAEKLFEEVQLLQQENAALRQQLAWCKAQMFGPGKSETLDRLQTTLALPVPEKPVAQKTETIVYERRVAAKEKRPLPAEAFAHVPVKETIVIEPDEVKAQPEAFERIGEERTFEIDIVAPQIFKREIVRPK